MPKLYLLFIAISIVITPVFSQRTVKDSLKFVGNSPVSSTSTTDTVLTKTTPINPIFGVGVGVFTFYGDINSKHLAELNTSRFAYDFSLSQNINDYLNLRFYALFGKMGMTDLNPYRHLNFETQSLL